MILVSFDCVNNALAAFLTDTSNIRLFTFDVVGLITIRSHKINIALNINNTAYKGDDVEIDFR